MSAPADIISRVHILVCCLIHAVCDALSTHHQPKYECIGSASHVCDLVLWRADEEEQLETGGRQPEEEESTLRMDHAESEI